MLRATWWCSLSKTECSATAATRVVERACSISSRVFITNGPCRTMGSRVGLPEKGTRTAAAHASERPAGQQPNCRLRVDFYRTGKEKERQRLAPGVDERQRVAALHGAQAAASR